METLWAERNASTAITKPAALQTQHLGRCWMFLLKLEETDTDGVENLTGGTEGLYSQVAGCRLCCQGKYRCVNVKLGVGAMMHRSTAEQRAAEGFQVAFSQVDRGAGLSLASLSLCSHPELPATIPPEQLGAKNTGCFFCHW